MIDLATTPPARLFTAFGTVLYVDVVSGELRHGTIESSPANAVFAANPNSAGPQRHGYLMHDEGGLREPLVCLADRCLPMSRSESASDSASPTLLELIPLERGLIAFCSEEFFLSSFPGGQVKLSAPACSTWELFLASEAWCSDAAAIEEPVTNSARSKFDKEKIEGYIIHPLIRARANTKSKAQKVLIYGYTKWSHGRVYYDLCKHLHRHGYIVDILDWQVNHSGHIGEIISYYGLFMTALDGVRTLVDSYGIPYEKIIALSHGELDIQILIDQKGLEPFAKFAGYGVVSYGLLSASLTLGVTRIPAIVPLGVNFAEFQAAIKERLLTVGYAGSISHKTRYGLEWKRGELARECAVEAGLHYKPAGSIVSQVSFHDMPEYYKTVDAVLITSLQEGAGLPALEAAAAGRLVISTPVGHVPLKAYEGGGIIAPIDPGKFIAFTAATLRYYKENPAAYVTKCRAIQEAAKKFDWQYSIPEWIELIENAIATRDHVTAEQILEPLRFEVMAGGVSEMEITFSRIYREKGFGGSESVSGPGSSLASTAKLRAELPEILRSQGIKRMIDAPCGDMNWMRGLEYKFDFFIGVDVVPDLIERLRTQLSSEEFHFQVGDICQQILPEADAIFCRDCFVHLPFSRILDAIRLFKISGAKYLLTTTFPDRENFDISTGDWRPLNLQAEPFLWPTPIGLIKENRPEDSDPWTRNKSIGVWALESLSGRPLQKSI
jgi:glycosyltransferase involved in cell wall biosynthesis